MQSINQPQAALIAGMQGSNPEGIASLQGQPFDQQLGGRGMYAGGGTAIGGGNFTGIPMGNRTGFGILKKIGRRVRKLIPKEIAPAMMAAAPFMGPIAGPITAGLGSYKATGKLNPYVMAASVAPHIRFGGPTGVGYGNWGGGSSIRNILTGQGRGTSEGILNTRFGDFGKKLDANVFGSGPTFTKDAQLDKVIRMPGKEGIFDLGGDTVGKGDLLNILKKKVTGSGSKMDQATRIYEVMTVSSNYADLLDNAAKQGIPPEALPVASEDEFSVWLKSQDDLNLGENYKTGGRVGYNMGSNPIPMMSGEEIFIKVMTENYKPSQEEALILKDYLDTQGGNAEGGIPRTRYAMGSAQFPPQKRAGLKWGSDKGEGLGGMEVEADMRYDGGFMPYGEEPKADDVPARLSKDEFVFTDEAVAGAGDGDVNAGAERLYNMMKNLEQGGRLSEESEGIASQEMEAMI